MRMGDIGWGLQRAGARVAFSFALLIFAISSVSFAQEPMVYRHCVLNKAPYGDPSFHSAVFRVRANVIREGLENDFAGFVAAHFDADASSGALCFGPFDTYQQAANNQNDIMARDRRFNKYIVITRWAYREE